MGTEVTFDYPCLHVNRRYGDQWKFSFENGRGASVIRTQTSYGGTEGLFELAVMTSDGDIDYSTPITDDVLGYLTIDDVNAALRSIDSLPADGS